MTGFAKHASQHSLVCRICSSPIPLDASNTDEYGRAVHEACYVSTTISRFRIGRAGSSPKIDAARPLWPTAKRLSY